MKKTITQLTLLCAFLVMGTITYAQCTGSVYIRNNSGEDWTVSYYNNDLVVPAGTDATLGFINANPTIGRGVLRTANPNDCNHKFQTNPDFWLATCAPSTTGVYYEAVLTPSTGCYNSGRIYIF
jgi:hypothetical protein